MKMTRTTLAALVLAASCLTAQAQPTYDRRIDEAAARIVAAKMGELRGTLRLGKGPATRVVVDALPTATIAREAIRAVSQTAKERALVRRKP